MELAELYRSLCEEGSWLENVPSVTLREDKQTGVTGAGDGDIREPIRVEGLELKLARDQVQELREAVAQVRADRDVLAERVETTQRLVLERDLSLKSAEHKLAISSEQLAAAESQNKILRKDVSFVKDQLQISQQ